MLNLDRDLRAGLALAWLKEAADLYVSPTPGWQYSTGEVMVWQCGKLSGALKPASGDTPDLAVWTALNCEEKLPTVTEPICGGWEVFDYLLQMEDIYENARPTLTYRNGVWVAYDPEYKVECTAQTPLEAVQKLNDWMDLNAELTISEGDDWDDDIDDTVD